MNWRSAFDCLTAPSNAALLILAAAVAAIGGAWAYESLGYLPCELCYKERVPYYAAFALAPLAAFSAQTGRAGLARAAFLLMALLFAGNAALSIYHSGVEWKIFAGPSDCSGALSRRALGRGFHEAASDRQGRALRRADAVGAGADAGESGTCAISAALAALAACARAAAMSNRQPAASRDARRPQLFRLALQLAAGGENVAAARACAPGWRSRR